MTATEHAEHTVERHGEHAGHDEPAQHKPNSFYIKVAVALAFITGVEVAPATTSTSASCSCRCC